MSRLRNTRRNAPALLTNGEMSSLLLAGRGFNAGARRSTHGRGTRATLGSCSQPSSNQNTKGDTKKDIVERKAKTHAHGNTHADGRLTFLAIGQVGPPIQSSTHHNTADVDRDCTAAGHGVQRGGEVPRWMDFAARVCKRQFLTGP